MTSENEYMFKVLRDMTELSKDDPFMAVKGDTIDIDFPISKYEKGCVFCCGSRKRVINDYDFNLKKWVRFEVECPKCKDRRI